MPSETPSSLSRKQGNVLFTGAAQILGKRKSVKPHPADTKRHATTAATDQEFNCDKVHNPSCSSLTSSESDTDELDELRHDHVVTADSSRDAPLRELKSHQSTLNKEIARVQCVENTTYTASGPSQEQNHGFPIVYRIECPEERSKSQYHKTFLFEDDPLTAQLADGRQSSHLSGNKPIYQLQNHVRHFRQPSFAIIKNRHCRNRSGFSFSRFGQDETMLILDDELQQTIRKVTTCSLEPFLHKSTLEFPAPYKLLYLHRDLLHTYAHSTGSALSEGIQAIIGYVVANYGHEYDEAESLLSQRKTTRRHIDKIFWPNQLIAFRDERSGENGVESIIVHVVQEWPDFEQNWITLKRWCWDYNGYWCTRSTRKSRYRLHFESETESFPVETLSFFPFTVLSEETRESLRQRGKKFWALLRPNFVYCTGNDRIKSGRYMIDHIMHTKLHSHFNSPILDDRSKQIDPWSRLLPNDSIPTEDEYLMMPTEIPGYDLLTKEWIDLPVSSITPIRWNKQPFEDLVLPEEIKRLVRAMVTIRASSIKSHREEQLRTNFDIIPGKGNGLIMLFHGSPGTGKTLTAESVAEIAEMPLYPITCGDIGTDPDRVEEYLRLVFELGQRWNCVLLLDEADVFLEQRTLTDLQRNSLVSVFLRMLEYYEGILILTSNRVGTFDEAFRSRIHIALQYEDLKPRARRQIWLNFLTRLEDTEEGEGVEEIKDRLDELARHQLNGREIRNALSTARHLASHEGKKMGWEHVELAIKTADKFGNYLRDVHGHTDREWAKEKGERL